MNLENKVKYNELSPSLQEMINDKLDTKEFNCHNNDEVRHIIQDERSYWNDVERICKEYTDDEINKLDRKLTKRIDDLINSLADIAFTGSYYQLLDKPILPGMIVPFNGNKIPTGWHICDGTNGTPDLRDRFIVGAGGNYNLGKTGGENYVKLGMYELPNHAHSRGTMNITGRFNTEAQFGGVTGPGVMEGCFYPTHSSCMHIASGVGGVNSYYNFDASRSWTGVTSYEGGGDHMRTALLSMH